MTFFNLLIFDTARSAETADKEVIPGRQEKETPSPSSRSGWADVGD